VARFLLCKKSKSAWMNWQSMKGYTMTRALFRGGMPLALIALLCAAHPVYAAPTPIYTVLALGTLGGPSSLGNALNALGAVAGQADLSGGTFQAYLTSPGQTISPGDAQGTLFGFDDSVAYGVNDSGQTVGYAYMSGGSGPLAFVSAGGVLDGLGTFGGTQSVAFGINNSGVVVGGAETATGYSNAFAHGGTGTLNAAADDLGTLGGDNSTAEAVNNAGTIVGEAQTAAGAYHAFVDTTGASLTAANDRGTLGGVNSEAYGISENGLVVGMSETGANDLSGNPIYHAFLDTGSGLIDLGTLGGSFLDSVALGVSSSGVIVGNAEEGPNSGPGAELAFVDFGSGLLDLNTLVAPGVLGGDMLISANAVNDNGAIVADGYDSSTGTYQAFLLQPQTAAIPEAGPGTLFAAAVPVLFLLAFRRIRRKTLGL
jgi:probable HAF family extracellular repeat protein